MRPPTSTASQVSAEQKTEARERGGGGVRASLTQGLIDGKGWNQGWNQAWASPIL